MCGIVGEIGPQACGEKVLRNMMGMLTHRGPDEAGLLVAGGVALGHLRLSIIDLKSGQQPMSSPDGRYWITFNGEIFNYPELRADLVAKGHLFLTQSDTEVLIAAYREWGAECLHRFNGQWAFAIWDRQEHSFFLARDRWGVRPLFYTILPDQQTVVFASELKAILADERVPREWDYETLRDIFVSWASRPDRTPLHKIGQLPPGCYLQINEKGITQHQWWELDYSPEAVEWERSEESWNEEVRAVLTQACTLRLRSDVPVGAYLSGGLDSSIIASLTASVHSNTLTTFSISFSDAAYDESSFQRVMVEHLGTDHREIQITREAIAENFRRVIWHTETPIYRTAPVPMLVLSRLVRDAGFRVVLTGEGSDELFGGYDLFKEDKIRRFWARRPNSPWRKRLLERLEANMPRANSRTRAFWYGFYQQHLQPTDGSGYSHYVRWTNGLNLLQLFSQDVAGILAPGQEATLSQPGSTPWIGVTERQVPAGFAGWDPLSKAQFWEATQLLSGYLLSSQGDRMAMAHSIEGRYPFLDVNVYEVARRMPPNQKLRVLNEKRILKRAFQTRLPEAVVHRHKNPYRAPDALALYHGARRDLLIESLSEGATRRRGLFSPEAVARLLARVQSTPEPSARDNMAIVLIYSSHLFHDLFVDGAMTPNPLVEVKTRIDLTGNHSDMTHVETVG